MYVLTDVFKQYIFSSLNKNNYKTALIVSRSFKLQFLLSRVVCLKSWEKEKV